MFKKIEIWILYLVVLLSILFAVFFGILVRQELVGNVKLGWASKTALTLAEIPVNLKKIFAGEFKVPDKFPDNKSGFSGVHNSNQAYLLLSRYDGDLKEGLVELVNLANFEVLHTWNPDIDAFNKSIEKVNEFKFIERDRNNTRSFLRHPLLTKDGGLLFKEFSPLRKIDACSNLIFQNTHDIFHHSIETDIDGNIWTAIHMYPQTLPIEKIGIGTPNEYSYIDDGVIQLSPIGEIIYEKSISQIFIDNGLEHLLFSVGDTHFDIDPIHLNDVQPVNYDGEFWKKGDIFMSLRHQSMVLLYRPSTNVIVWKGVGPFFHQHDVDILDDHKIAIFNNNSKDFINGDMVDGYNEVIIYNFKNNKYSSYLPESFVNNDIKTVSQGTSEILPNGDLFVEDTTHGRTLYFNADGTLRWSHINRADNGYVYYVSWSRILYSKKDLQIVENFLNTKGACNE